MEWEGKKKKTDRKFAWTTPSVAPFALYRVIENNLPAITPFAL